MPPIAQYGANDLRTTAQNSRLFALLGKLDIDAEQRKELVMDFTQGRTNSTREMTVQECDALIRSLDAQLGSGEGDKSFRMRRKVYSLAHELGWEESSGKVCKERLQNWINKFGKHHMELNKMTPEQLRDTITQLEVLADKYDKAHRHG